MYHYYRTPNILCIIAVLFLSQMANAIRRPQQTFTSDNIEKQKNIGLQSISEDAARSHVYFLSHNLLEGRQAGTRGSQLAQQYIISRMREIGIRPYTDSYLQAFSAVARPVLHRQPRYYVETDSVNNILKVPHYILNMANVIAVIPGNSSADTIVIGAHFDHEGISPTLAGDKIYNRADDNASGVSAVLQIMQAFVKSGATPHRTIIFAFWDGEELGTLGSRYFVQHFQDASHIKAYLNFDMIGGNNRPDDPQYFVYFYTENHPLFGNWLKEDLSHYHFVLHPNYKPWDNPIGGSDQGSFARHGIPIIWYHTDAQPHYNKPSDEAQTINYSKLTNITRISFLTAWHLANNELW